MTTQFLHQGSAALREIAPVKNTKFQKPEGGLWLTPEDGISFYEFLGRDETPESFTLDVSDRNILVVALMGFFKADNRYSYTFIGGIAGDRPGKMHKRWDWEKLAGDYDGVYFTEEVLELCECNCPLYSVDFPSLLLFR